MILFFLISFDIFLRVEPIFPAQSSLFLFIFLNIFFAELHLLFLQKRKYIGRRFNSKVEILECISFNVFVGKQFINFLINFGISDPLILLFLLLAFKMRKKELRQLFFEGLVIEPAAFVQGNNIFDRQIIQNFLLELPIVKNIFQLQVIKVDYFFLLRCIKIICQKFILQLNLSWPGCQMLVGGYYSLYLSL